MARPTKAAEALGTRLGGDLPPGVARLKAADLGRLDALVTAAEEHQRRVLAEGTERGLRLVPRLLRGPILKALKT